MSEPQSTRMTPVVIEGRERSGTQPTYFPNLDGLRALAALSVILYHCTNWLVFPKTEIAHSVKRVLSLDQKGGTLGVQFFFVLSGFLITYLIFAERARTGQFRVLRFYARRFLRIWPLYFASLLVGFGAFPVAMHALGKYHTENASLPLYAGFLANFDHIFNGPPTAGVLGVQWSVAIEEQFYLVWPLVFVTASRRFFLATVASLMTASFAFHFLLQGEPTVAYYHSLSAAGFLAFGALLAYVTFFHGEKVRRGMQAIPRAGIGATYLGMLALTFGEGQMSLAFPPAAVIFRVAMTVFFGFVLLEQNFSPHSVAKLGHFRTLSWLGQISYGLYLNHMIPMYLVSYALGGRASLVVVCLGIAAVVLLTVLISAGTYAWLERPFLELKPEALPRRALVDGKGEPGSRRPAATDRNPKAAAPGA